MVSAMRSTRTLFIALSLLAVLATMAAMQVIDTRLALGVWKFTSSHPFLHRHFRNIHNTLPHLVAAGSTGMWLAWVLIRRRKGAGQLQQFLQLAATAVPLAYLLKLFLQDAFGRTNLRLWLRARGPLEFRWFNPLEYGGFPSGHTLVFTAFFTAVWLFYPRLRPLAAAAVALLGAALVFTSYHFVSDIMAGVLCGVLITAGLHRFLSNSSKSAS
jgi:membrane-associated phospholipid phosphatase